MKHVKKKKSKKNKILFSIGIIIIIIGILWIVWGQKNLNSEKVITLGKIELISVNQFNEPIIGEEFALYDYEENLLLEIKTGTDGKVMFYKVPVGDYILKIKNLDSKYKSNQEEQVFSVQGGKTTTITFTNTWQEAIFSLYAVDSNDSETKISGATFELYDEEGYILSTMTTNNEGLAQEELEPGTYYFQQQTTKNGYKIDDTLYRVKISNNQKTFKTTIKNEKE